MASLIRSFWPILIFLGLLTFFAFGLTRDPSLLPSEMIDRPVPEFKLSALHQPDDVLTEDMFSGRISLVNVFGSWCVACVVEPPKLMSLSDSNKFTVIGINWRDKREAGKLWLRQNGDPYAQIIFDEESRLAIDLGVTGAPESFIIDKAGRIRYKHVGIITDEVWNDILSPIISSLEAEQ